MQLYSSILLYNEKKLIDRLIHVFIKTFIRQIAEPLLLLLLPILTYKESVVLDSNKMSLCTLATHPPEVSRVE